MTPALKHELLIRALFAEILDAPQVAGEDDFFELGGESLTGTRMISRIRAEFGVELTLRQLFEAPTPRQLAEVVETADRAGVQLKPATRPARIPPSFAQQRLWFLNRLEGPSPTYNVSLVYQLTGELDHTALNAALRDVVGRHESLRTVFPDIDGQPEQRVLPLDQVGTLLTTEHVDPADVEDRLRAAASHAFDLAGEIPVRARLLQTGPRTYVLLILIHHIAADEWSKAPLARDLARAYDARCRNEAPIYRALPVQYVDYALWQRELLGDAAQPGSMNAAQLKFWTDALTGLPEELGLPFDRPRPAMPSYRGSTVHFHIDAEVHRRLVALARRKSATMFMLFHAAMALLMAKLSGGTDIPLGTPVAGRADEALDDLVGFFVNTVVLRTDLSGDPTFEELLARVRDGDLAVFANQDIPFEQVVEAVNPARSLARNPLFQVSMTAQPMDTALSLPGLDASGQTRFFDVSRFDMNINLDEQFTADREPNGVAGQIEFSTDLFDTATAEAIGARLARILAAVAEDSTRRPAQIDVLAPAERHRILAEWNATARTVPAMTLPAMLEAQAARTPDAPAVQGAERTLTYAQLNAEANRLARALIRDGVGPESLVALRMTGSLDFVVAVWAVLKAGAAYLPIDPAYPDERIEFMLADAKPALVLTELPDTTHADLPSADLADDERLGAQHPMHPCYVIYTSGSTGVPKAVVMPAGAMVNLVDWCTSLERPKRTIQFAASGFDVAALEILSVTTGGGCLVVPEQHVRKDAELLVDWLAEQEIDDLSWLPNPMLEALCEAANTSGAALPALRRVGQAGDALVLSPTVREFIGARGPELRLDNGYGPTETHWTTTYRLPADIDEWPTAPPIGRPNANTQAYVLDRWLHPVPAGVVGELYLGGAQLARGYLNRPAETAERFTACPFGAPGARMYRTGDLARWRADGTLDFLGRVDHQVKVRGFRIELGEIETALRRHPDVAQAAVIAIDEDGPAAGKRVVAYVVPAARPPEPETLRRHVDRSLPDYSDALRRHVARSLPDYMVPSAFVLLDRLPRSPNGKLDRAALPRPTASASGRAPRTDTERALCALFAEILAVSAVSADGDFFALGGHSLTATKLMSRLRARLHVELPLRSLFDARTPAGLATLVETALQTRVPLEPRERPAHIPLSFAQQRLWFLDRLEGPILAYNNPLVTRVEGPLDRSALDAALRDVVGRHESLRTVFPEVDGQPEQRVLPPDELGQLLAVEQVDPAALDDRLREAVSHGFDLAAELPLRAWLFELEPDVHVLLILLHHIASDGWSMAPLARDLAQAYDARCQGTEPAWAPLPVQYADYTLWQRELLADAARPDSANAARLEFWTRALDALPEELDLPFDRPRPATRSYRGAAVPFPVDPELHARLIGLARDTSTTVFMVCHAAVALLLAKLSGGVDIPIGTAVAGRADEALDDLVGFFVNTVVLRTDLSGDPTFRELLARVRENDLAVFAHQDIPFEQVVEAVNPARSLARNPLFQVLMAFNSNLYSTAVGLPGLSERPQPVPVVASRVDLSVNLREEFGADGAPLGVDGELEYSSDLFDRESVAAIAERLRKILLAATADPALRVSQFDLLTPQEREQLLVEWNGSPTGHTGSLPFQRFEEQAALTPDATAVVFEDETVDYADLNARANRLARLLIERGVGPEDRVAVLLPPSVELVVALLAVWKAGGAYVPIDPEYPEDRIAYMLEDAAPQLILREPAPILTPDEYSAANISDAERRTPIGPTHPAYVIYTSGSTGRPKGVVVDHGNLASVLRGLTEYLDFGPTERSLASSTISFDAATAELFLPLTTGATAILVRRATVRTPRELLALVERQQVSVIQATATLCREIVAEADGQLAGVHLVVGGEPTPADLVPDLVRHAKRVSHGYGPTENSIYTTCGRLAGDETAPLHVGAPLSNTRAYVLGDALELVPPGVIGSLYLAGDGVARGYLAKPGLTAARFVASPFGEPGERMYRTGDLVRWDAHGRLVYLGRDDDQVKVRGFRIELGEIDAVLREQPGVAHAAAAVHTLGAGDQRLVGYVVPEPDAALDLRRIREQAAAILPGYMVPATVTQLDRLPRTLSGKLDRRALPKPEFTADATTEPRTPLERLLCDLFAEVLDVPRVGADDSFFALGGHSLLVIRLAGRIRAALGVELNIQDLFDAPTPAGLAAGRIGGGSTDSARSPAPLVRLRAGDGDPLFCIHPAAGVGWSYSGLLRHVGDERPVYALQAPGLSAPGLAPNTPEELVTDYLARIRAVQPRGPYALLGWSLGGMIAHMLAVRIQAEGDDVALLALLDSYPAVAVAGVHDPQAADEAILRDLSEMVGTGHDSTGSGLAGLADLDLDTVLSVARDNIRLCTEKAPGIFRGDVLFFAATADKQHGSPSTPLLWREYVTGDVEVHPVDCAHSEITRPSALDAIGPLVGARLPATPHITAGAVKAAL